MEIGNEISQKIRSAIKAKLVDLGVYVDDELPDYIMVMVANKKSQDQMTEDLNLFLSNNTEKFTSWLHALLTKLQSITADAPKPPKPPPDAEAEVTAVVKETPEPNEDELLIGPEHDDFEEEANREAAVPAATPPIVSRPSAHPQSSTMPESSGNRRTETRSSGRESRAPQSNIWSTRGASTDNQRRPLHDTSRRREHSPRRDIRSRLGPSAQGTERLSESTLQRQRAAVRKRRAPESVVGSVVRHDVEEEQYDPRRPLIGRVASTVKVGDRRPTVPPGQQANKSLLLKAMTEARDSIAKATARLTEQVAMEEEEVVPAPRGMGSNRGGDRERPPPRAWGTRARERPRIEPRGSMRSSGSSQPITRVAPQPAMQSSSNGAAGRSVELYSRSKREEVLQQFRAGLHSDSEDMADQESEELPVRTEAAVILDNRQIHLGSQEEDSILEQDTEQRTISIAPIRSEYRQEEEALDTLIESGAEESDFTDEEGEARIVQETQMEPPKERPSSPKFVVTLDGVDPTALARSNEEDMDDSELDMQIDGDSPKTATIVRVAPQRITTSTPNSMELYHQYFSEASEFDEDESAVSPPKRSKVLERCKFWLACRNGNNCPYHHPSVPCKMFPKCKFGEKCLYIHPNCRFDANCTRANCPFTHATKRSSQPGPTALPVVIQPYSVVAAPPTFQSFTAPAVPAQQQLPAQATCRFFPKCTNMSCKFLHPKPCRYGLGCRNKEACTYTHPDLPPTNKLKWTAPNINRSLSVDSGSSVFSGSSPR